MVCTATEPSPSTLQVSSSEEERVLDPDERVLDLVAYWCRIELEEKHKKGKTADIEEFRFVYKVGSACCNSKHRMCLLTSIFRCDSFSMSQMPTFPPWS